VPARKLLPGCRISVVRGIMAMEKGRGQLFLPKFLVARILSRNFFPSKNFHPKMQKFQLKTPILAKN